jgi:putative two-component system response regulator
MGHHARAHHRRHKILSVSDAPIFKLAAEIALSHHEKWAAAATRKTSRARTSRIGRITAIADVFDALTMERPYKEPWSVDKAMEYIRESDGHFEPRLADLFLSISGRYRTHPGLLEPARKDELFTVSLEAIS